MGLFTLIVSWWRARQRRIDVDILWPICVAGVRDVDHAKATFMWHAMHDPAWRELGEDAIVKCIDWMALTR